MEPCYNDSTNKEEEDSHSYAMELSSSSVLPMVLMAVVELKVLDIIAKAGPGAQLSPSEIASRLPAATHNPDAPEMLDRMLRLLASHSILTCSVDLSSDQPPPPLAARLEQQRRLYGLLAMAKYFVSGQDRGVSSLLLVLQDKVFMESWYELKGAVVERGIPFDRVHGMHAFEYPGKDPRFNELFNKAMINHTTIVLNNILQSSYKGFEQVQKLVDVGGSLGVTLNLITSKYPHIEGVNFDLPHVIQHAPPYPGVEHVGGDMFESVPRGDAIFMKAILHDWSDDQCLKLLKNCHKALPDNGKIIVVEGILPVIPDSSAATKGIFQFDLVVMTQNPGGKERTKQEFMALATGAGFSGIRFECFVCNFWVMEFYK
ncbi:caffeic acid 3-O-methyltransferase-like isoform X1 [Rhododendron vialii]|uniref:caffeic acid 3-O-methyltransferase-like isoform X1 n=1 Tax=Rhododendron vialii TaxID=182163 RepID=UPI00265E9970|nr:caffeic acid 3-O-methyltransferase-like isoform X1 [Rhododendron vialii]